MACARQSATSWQRTGFVRPPARCGVTSGVVLARRANPGLAGYPDPKRDSAGRLRTCPSPIIGIAIRKTAGALGFEEGIDPIDIAYPVLWRNLTAIVASVLDAIGQDPKLAPAPMLERQANQRSDEWVDRYRAEAPRLGLPT